MKKPLMVLPAVLMAVSLTAFTAFSRPSAVVEDRDRAPAEFKFMVLLNKQDTVTFEQYERYFFETHLPYVLKIPGLRGYTVNMRQPEDSTAPYDGISEFWFDDKTAFDRAMASPETEATLADAAKFLMPPQIFLVNERIPLPLER